MLQTVCLKKGRSQPPICGYQSLEPVTRRPMQKKMIGKSNGILIVFIKKNVYKFTPSWENIVMPPVLYALK